MYIVAPPENNRFPEKVSVNSSQLIKLSADFKGLKRMRELTPLTIVSNIFIIIFVVGMTLCQILLMAPRRLEPKSPNSQRK